MHISPCCSCILYLFCIRTLYSVLHVLSFMWFSVPSPSLPHRDKANSPCPAYQNWPPNCPSVRSEQFGGQKSLGQYTFNIVTRTPSLQVIFFSADTAEASKLKRIFLILQKMMGMCNEIINRILYVAIMPYQKMSPPLTLRVACNYLRRTKYISGPTCSLTVSILLHRRMRKWPIGKHNSGSTFQRSSRLCN